MKNTEDKLIYEFNETTIEFQLNGEKDVKVNATQMAKVYGKRLDVFLKAEHTKAFIEALQFTPNGVNSAKITIDDIIETKGQNGTFMHRALALKFAAWLNPHFEVWVYMKIEDLLFGMFSKQKKRLEQKAKDEIEIKQLKQELELENNIKYRRIAELEVNIKKGSSKTRLENTKQLNIFRDQFSKKE